MSNFKQTESAKVLESVKFRTRTVLSSIEDIRVAIGNILYELREISDLADTLKDLVDAEDE